MSLAAIDHLVGSSEALIAALDSHDIEAIESALPAFGTSVGQLRSSGGWEQSPEISERLAHALSLADSARSRVRYLADRTQQRIDLLSTAAGRFDCTPATYSRPR